MISSVATSPSKAGVLMQRVRGCLRTCRSTEYFQHRKNSTLSHSDVVLNLRNLMRSSAQPVTVMTTRLNDAKQTCHGAVLSSFTSVGFDPFPLVAFAIRKPSRLADALHANKLAQPSSVHGIINILADHQSEISKLFSRPDLYAQPFNSVAYGEQEGMPILEETIGALSCSVVTSLPLTRGVLNNFGLFPVGSNETTEPAGQSSELFLARVIQVLSPRDNSSPPRKPLVLCNFIPLYALLFYHFSDTHLS
ncbi:hypothetical protein OPQ81_007871 [Rhizoctonia solani]|nr:hypothetical protein OPQ81_007871 [Rhizoctonia solani]